MTTFTTLVRWGAVAVMLGMFAVAVVLFMSGCTWNCPSGEQPVYSPTTHQTTCQH